MSSHRKSTLSQHGGVSLLSVVIFATIITVIITMYTSLTLYQQQESINYDSSTRAYYAAQSGLADTAQLIDQSIIKAANYPNGKKEDCAPVLSRGKIGSGQNQVEYTCQLIDFQPTSLTKDNINEDTSVIFPLVPIDKSSTEYTFTITWNKEDSVARPWDQRMALPPRYQWRAGPAGANYTPIMRAMFFWSDINATNRDTIRNRTFFLTPASSIENSNQIKPEIIMSKNGGLSPQNNTNEGLTGLSGSTGILGVPMYSSECGGGKCKSRVVIKEADLNSRQLFVALRPIYDSVDNVSIDIVNNSFASGQATIDITGKSGNAYRRLKQAVPYSVGDAPKVMTSYFPDYSLVSGDGICKLYKVNTSNAENSGCPE